MRKIDFKSGFSGMLQGKKKRLVIALLVLVFLLGMPRLLNRGIQAADVFIDDNGVLHLPDQADKNNAQAFQALFAKAEKENNNVAVPAAKISEDVAEEEPPKGTVINLGKSLSADNKRTDVRRDNSASNTPALIIPKDEKKDPAAEDPNKNTDGNNAKEEPPLFLPPGAGRDPGNGGGLVPVPGNPNNPGNPGGPGTKPPAPTNPQPPVFKWRYADPNRPAFAKLKISPTAYSQEEFSKLNGNEWDKGKLIVKFKDSVNANSVMAQGMSLQSTTVYDVESLFDYPGAPSEFGGRYYRMKVDEKANVPDVCNELIKNGNVEICEPEFKFHILKTPNDPMFNQLWGMQKIQADKAWDINEGSSSVIVGVSDTGVDGNHPDLKDNLVPGNSFVGGSPTTDNVGHGTHVSGTIAAVGNNGVGVIGVAPRVKIMPLKISDSPSIDLGPAIQSLTYAADHGVKVVNMSWGGPQVSQALQDAIKYAYSKDVVLVAAAGNGGGPPVMYPAAYPEVIAVSAVDSNDQIASFSSYGPQVSVAAPGVGILSTVPGGSYQTMSGTSMACPHAVGVVALIRSAFPNLKADDVKKRLIESVDDLGAPGRDDQFGYGRINAYKAIKDGGGPSPTPSPSPGPGWDFTPPGYLTSSLKAADMDGDGKDEIIFISTNEYKENYKGAQLFIMDGKGIAGTPVEIKGRGWSTPAIEDINADGVLDVVVTAEEIKDGTSSVSSGDGISVQELEVQDKPGIKVYIIRFADSYKAPSSPVVYDINADGKKEIVMFYLDTSKIDSGFVEQKLAVLDSEGKKLDTKITSKVKIVYRVVDGGFFQACTPTIDDFNDDGKAEIVVGDVIVDGKLCLLAALDIDGNVVAKVEDPKGSGSLYSRIVAVKNMYKAGKTAFLLVRATETKDEVYVIDLFGEGIISPWPKEFDQPFTLFDPVPLNIDGDSNGEFAVRATDNIPLYHHEGSISQGFPVKDNGGNIRVIKADKGKKDLLVGSAIYAEEGKVVANFSSVAKGEFVMDQAIGKFSPADDKENIILLIVDKDGKEHLKPDVLPANGTDERSPWPMYRKSLDNQGVEILPIGTPTPTPTPGTNSPPQFSQINDWNATSNGWLSFNFSVSDPEGDSFTVTGEGPDPNFDPWKTSMAPSVGNNSFIWALINVPIGTYPVRLTATDSKGAQGKVDFKINVQ